MAVAIAAVLLLAGAGWASVDLPVADDAVLIALLVGLTLLAEAGRVEIDPRFDVTGSDCLYLFAVPFAGTAAGVLVAAASSLAGWAAGPYRRRALVINLAGVVLPVATAGAAFHAIDTGDGGARFTIGLVVEAVLALGLNLAIVLPLMGLLDGVAPGTIVPSFRPLLFAFGFQGAFVVVIATVAEELGNGAAAFGVVLVLAYAYMLRLIVRARDRTRAYANLSWGVLSSLVRTLDARDSRTARHCAAVARFSRDIAAALGEDRQGQELAHTAGLLHDIGKFTLSDRVMEREGDLLDEDWTSIRRHPAIGAELLQDIGVYGPVAEIVRAHHERIDGRGYPDRVKGDDIPLLARVVAVAEVYDTLTAPDTYRTPMTSFEALRELRRVAGSQLDERCVEAMATVLSGQDTGYRHADDADFDRELDIQRRMNEAAAT